MMDVVLGWYTTDGRLPAFGNDKWHYKLCFMVLVIVFGVKLIEFVVKYWIYYLYEKYKHRYKHGYMDIQGAADSIQPSNLAFSKL